MARLGKEIDTGLPPAGYERDEEMLRREDDLAEQAEVANAKIEGGTGDISQIRIENELAQHFDELAVLGAVDGRAYAWVPTHTYGRFVQQKLYKGWQMVQGDMPEAAALKSTDTTRRLGDVVLMWISREKKEALDRREEWKKIQQEEGVTSHLQEMAERYGTSVVTPENINPEMMRRMQTRAEAKTKAGRMMERWMKQGRMPGVGV